MAGETSIYWEEDRLEKRKERSQFEEWGNFWEARPRWGNETQTSCHRALGGPWQMRKEAWKKKGGKCNETVVRAMVLKLYEPPNPLGGLLAHWALSPATLSLWFGRSGMGGFAFVTASQVTLMLQETCLVNLRVRLLLSGVRWAGVWILTLLLGSLGTMTVYLASGSQFP